MILTIKLRVLLMLSGKLIRNNRDGWKPIAIWAIAFLALAGIVLYVAETGAPPQSGKSGLQVVAAENFWGSIAAQIGGSRANVTSIITDPNADPHLYESDARDAIAISTANIVITNGLGYDDFMDKILSASPNAKRQVLKVADILNVGGNNANPHLWYDTPKVPVVAAAMESAMATHDPADKAVFEKNLASFDTSLQPMFNTIAQIKERFKGDRVAYTERVPGYLLANAGLDEVTPPGFASAIEDGDDPSPADTAAMDNLMTSHSVKVLLYNAQTVSPVTQHVRQLAEANGIPVIGVTETLPGNEKNFQSWQYDQAQTLLRALSGE
jgi:zinc/manganese transport system substrate-binding protein